MDRRRNKVDRVVRVQKRLHQLAELKVAELGSDKRELAQDEAALIDALNRDASLQGLFIEAMARRLAVLAREMARVDRALDAETGRLFDEGLRLKRAERLSERVRQAELAAAWQRGFEELIARLGGKGEASLP
jgi:hypothetical protein